MRNESFETISNRTTHHLTTLFGPLEPEDISFGEDVSVVIDPQSLDLVRGSKVDFTEDLIRRSFEVVGNPQAETKCGCGSSFSVKENKA